MRIFLDVGAHYGETLDVALDPAWGFDRIYSFEPATMCQRILRTFRDPRSYVVPAGLSNRTVTAALFGAGMLGASVYADKEGLDGHPEAEPISLVRATDWLLANTGEEDDIYLKLNCEGSECDVLDDLLDSGSVDRIRSVYVDFDVRKIPSQMHRQQDVERRLRERDVHFVTPESLHGRGNDAVAEWLTGICPRTSGAAGVWRYRLRLYRPPYLWARSAARRALPKPIFTRVARRFGMNSRARLDERRGTQA